ncbi:hypothetical protein SLA2020_132150 [Shorea laevis]
MIIHLPCLLFPKLVQPLFRYAPLQFPSSSHSFNLRTPNFFLGLLKRCRNSQELKAMKSVLIVHGFCRNELLLAEFVGSCFDLGAPCLALLAFQNIKNPNLFCQNLMLKGLNDCIFFEELLLVYLKCRALGCTSNDFTFSLAIKACSALGAFEIGKEIHCIVLRTGYGGNVVTQTALVDFYGKNGLMGNARALIDEMPNPDLVSWNALLAGYSLNGLDHEALEIFREIQVMGLMPNMSTLASIIPLCTRLGCILIGKSLHGLAVKCGYFSNGFLVPALISMYASDADLSTARTLFDSLVKMNVIVWNAMINAYTQNKKVYEASEMFRQMLRASMQPDSVTFVSIIPSCENYCSICYGESLHACLIKLGAITQVSVLTALLSMYSKFGHINSALFLFDEMSKRNLLSWNALVSVYVNNELWGESLVAVHDMQLAGYTPDDISVVSILSACSRLEDALLGKSTHAFIVRRGLERNLNVSNALLAFYSDCCQLSSSFKLFQSMVTKNVVSWNTLISRCVYSGHVEKTAILVQEMQIEGIKLDLVTLISILPACTGCESLGQGMAIHGYAIRSGFEYEVSLVNSLINMYCDCGDLDSGRFLFEVMPERSLVSWNSLMTCYRHYNSPNDVLLLFAQMINEDQRPNHISLLNLLPVCCTQLQGKSIHAFAVRTGIVEETSLLTSLIFMYARFENINLCQLVFHMAQKGDISLWNAIMSVHIHSNNSRRAVVHFSDLLLMGLKPDNITVLSLISACAELNNLTLTDSIMAYVISMGFDKDVTVNNALINLYARCGNLFIAEKLFDNLLEKDAVSWSIMINGYGLHGDAEAALKLFSRMQVSGVRPYSFTYSSVLSACSHAGLVDQGLMIFNSMVVAGIPPRTEHYACMVDLLGRSGNLAEGYEIVNRLPFKPSVSMLQSLLGACRMHSNANLGDKIVQILMEIDPQNPEPYVMLHNIYAEAGNWKDASRVRSYMEGKQLKKIPGFSLLVQNEHHD